MNETPSHDIADNVPDTVPDTEQTDVETTDIEVAASVRSRHRRKGDAVSVLFSRTKQQGSSRMRVSSRPSRDRLVLQQQLQPELARSPLWVVSGSRCCESRFL